MIRPDVLARLDSSPSGGGSRAWCVNASGVYSGRPWNTRIVVVVVGGGGGVVAVAVDVAVAVVEL